MKITLIPSAVSLGNGNRGSFLSTESLRNDIFNGRAWPDFISMSENGMPFVSVELLEPGHQVEVGNLRLTPIAVDHVVPTLGFLVNAAGVTVAIPSDTGPTELFWRAAAAEANLKAVFLEVSFPDDMASLAHLSKHLTPSTFAGEIRKLSRTVSFIAVHIKPRFYDKVVAELIALGLPNVRVGNPGETYVF